MSFNAKEAAQKLFDLADVIEKQAAQKTFFVCASCNHTANLESINSTRAKFASEHSIETVSSISIEDTISCRACGGDMKYAATEESEKFFVEASEDPTDYKEENDIEDSYEEDSKEEDSKEEDSDEEDSDEEDSKEEDSDEEDSDEEDSEEAVKRTTKDKENSEGKVELKEDPEAKFGDKDKKSKTAFDRAVDRYSSF